MAPRNNELPEGTDHIVNGAMETGAGSGSPGTTSGGGTGSGFIGAGAGDGTGGTAAKGGTMATNTTGTTSGTSDGGGTLGSGTRSDDGGGTIGSGTSSTSGGGGGTTGSGTRSGGSDGGGSGGGVVDQLRSQATQLRDQAGGRARDFAESGKTRASDALEDLSRTIGETADSIDERLGSDYGEYARRAADAVSGVADTLRRQDVDALYENVRSAVRKSPGVAIGVAAVLGFTVARLIKAGLPSDEGSQTGTGGTGTGGSATGTGGTASTGS